MPNTLERLKQLFATHFDYDIKKLEAATTLEDLRIDSLDLTEFMFDIEIEFKIRIPDQEFRVKTIQEMVDAVDRLVLKQNTVSTSTIEAVSKPQIRFEGKARSNEKAEHILNM